MKNNRERKLKKTILFFCCSFLLSNSLKCTAVINETSKIDATMSKKTAQLVMNSINNNVDADDPEEILSRAIDGYKDQFADYIDITGLNVYEKESITLTNYNRNYVAPSYGEVMQNYQLKLEESLTPLDLDRYGDLRKKNPSFNDYVVLNKNGYKDLTITSKGNRAMSVAVASTLVALLGGAGLTETAISAFTGAVGTLSTALSTSWIPIVGWALAVGLAIGALIALTVIIVQYWDEICSIYEEIKDWFLEEFETFSNLINSYFNDAKTKVNESANVGTVSVGAKIFNFQQVNSKDVVTQAAMVKKVRWTGDVLLMQYVDSKGFQVSTETTTYEYCVSTQTHKQGYSSYTWYQNKARALIINAGSGLTKKEPEIDQSDDSELIFMKHFHNCRKGADGQPERIKEQPMHRTHSFFGQLYHYTSSKELEIHPLSPNPNPHAL